MSMPEYHATLAAIGADPSCAPMLADKFEEVGMDRHAEYFRTGYYAPRTAGEIVGILYYYWIYGATDTDEVFTVGVLWAITHMHLRFGMPGQWYAVTSPHIALADRLADYNVYAAVTPSTQRSLSKQ